MNNLLIIENHINVIIAGQYNAITRNDENANQPSYLPIDGIISKAHYWNS